MSHLHLLNPNIVKIIYVVLLIFGSVLLPYILMPLLTRHKTEHQRMLIEKVVRYLLLIISFFMILKLYEIDLKVILGAAGIFSVAIGFASQTSASNLISGIFLLLERPFKVGDTIVVGEHRGIVVSLDLLSTRLRTFDNLMVRIPNESLMKSNLTNMTHFPIRRIDIKIPLDFDVELEIVEKELNLIVADIIECLDEPKPIFLVDGMNEHSMIVQFSFWTRIENIMSVKKQVYSQMIRRLNAIGIKISLPKRILVNN
ncbi:mechanosensitive ion channel family protein [Bacteriovorax sp. Seq25_V]|uniref:mechanosensitive ion channel family protein n=1 Tax=Bacteriovorax sp. Seq25_V TaxID=1201288 RepID=UPI00038A4D10|nr:mechanosensitive ion channel family protein [Bacteriovorax sp. Seq25_V]EQC43868.1 transporter, small conductance mechanosensitive ion channel MscS family protein [Bacteriovorax sp. Seq25_V]